jgi:hypothetical protein
MQNSTLLYRQVNPAFIQQGNISSQAFRPTPKDNNRLSVYDGDLISAKDSHEHFTLVIGCLSAGVLAVSVQECLGENLPVISDPETFDEHALIDFTEHSLISKGSVIRKAETLRKYAVNRGWCYVESSTTD